MSDNTIGREALSRAATLVRPALASKEYVPALTHVLFAGGRASAYNDVAAISVAMEGADAIGRCVPGEKLIGALGSFGGADVVAQDDKDGALVLKSGRSRVKLPTLPKSDFPLELPSNGQGHEVKLAREVVRAVERCLVSVGTDAAHPAQSGVTLESGEDGRAVLYSTDNYSISRCATAAPIKLPADAPVILPKFFCEQLVSLARAFPDEDLFLVLFDGALLVDFGDRATLFTRTPVDVEPLDFPRIVGKHVKLSALRDAPKIPDAFDGALQRALLVTSGEASKTTKVTLRGRSMLLVSGAGAAEAEDEISYDQPHRGPEGSFYVDPQLLARGAKHCALMMFTDRVTAMADESGDFVHLVAHVQRV